MKIDWDTRVGPATVAAILSAAGVIGVNLWTASSNYRGLADKLEEQGAKIEQVAKGSDTRFQTVYNSLGKTRDSQQLADQRLGRVETAISYISSQVQRVEAKLDGSSPPAPAISAPKP
jgi:negative regulator of sigma E activity